MPILLVVWYIISRSRWLLLFCVVQEGDKTIFLANIRVLLTNQENDWADQAGEKGRGKGYYRNHDFNVYFTSISCVSCIAGQGSRKRTGGDDNRCKVTQPDHVQIIRHVLR